FKQHPHLRLNCRLPAAIGDLARLVKAVDPESKLLPDELDQAVTGNVKRRLEDLSVDIAIPNQEIELFDKKWLLKPSLGERYLVYSLAAAEERRQDSPDEHGRMPDVEQSGPRPLGAGPAWRFAAYSPGGRGSMTRRLAAHAREKSRCSAWLTAAAAPIARRAP